MQTLLTRSTVPSLASSRRSRPTAVWSSRASSSRRHAVRCYAFLKASECHKAAIAAGSGVLPLPPQSGPSSTPGLSFYTANTRVVRASDFFRAIVEEELLGGPAQQGPDVLSTIAERWGGAYSLDSVQELAVAEDEGTHDAFVFVASTVVNTGPFAGQAPTKAHSTVLGLYRVQLDDHGGVKDMWMMRSGTHEERQHLLKRDVPVPLWQQPWSSVSSVSSVDTLPSSTTTTTTRGLLPTCSWPVDHFYRATIMQNAALWTHDVMSMGSLSALGKVVAPSVCMHDGTGLLFAPLQGAAAVGHHLADQLATCELQPRKVLAQVAEKGGHKVFQHWTQARACRSTGQHTSFEGTTLLVFDSKARIQQVYEFVSLDPVWRSRLFSADAEQRVLGCWPAPSRTTAAGKAQAEAERAAAAAARARKEAEERAEVLARQEREWMSW